MHTPARRSPRRWRTAFSVALVPWLASALAAACSSSSKPPGELSSQDTGIAERPTPEPTPEPPPEPTPEPMPEAEAACAPLGDGGVVVTASSLMFGDGGMVGCGTQALPLTLTIDNDTCEPFDFTNMLTSGGSYYSVTPVMGTVPPHLTQTVTVNPNPIPQVSAVTPDLYEGTLSIATTAQGDSAHIVQLHMTAYGAILASTQLGTTLAFGGVSIGQTASAQFSVSNTGNAPTTLTLAVGSQYFSVGTADGGAPSFLVTANQSVAPVVKFSPTAVQPYTDTISTSVAAGTPLCAVPPPTTPLTGSGTTGVAVAPTNLDFGLIQCGQPAAAYQTITITNTGAAITYTPSFKLGINSPYMLTDNTAAANPIVAGNPVVLGAASNTTIRVVPKQITNPANTTADGYADTLTITTTGPGDVPHNVSLHETAQGTIFTLAPATVCLNNCVENTTLFQSFTVQNTGSLTASYTLAAVTTQGPAGTYTLPGLQGGSLSPGFSQTGQLYVKTLDCTIPDAMGCAACSQDLGTLTLTPAPGTILCADVPPPMPLSLNGPCH